MQFPHFCDGSYRVSSPVTAQTQLINWYSEIADVEGTVAKTSLLPTPGAEAFTRVVEVAGGRALYDTGHGRCFSVIGTALVEVLADGTYTIRGTVAIDEHPATIVTNGPGGNQLFITSGDKGYCYDLLTNTLTEVLSSGATQGGMLYGFFAAFDHTNGRLRISDLFDGLVWDPTQFAERTIGADPWRAMCITSNGQICLPGTKTGEFWYNSGAFPFPFAPDPSALFAMGIAATFSIKEVSGGLAWLATSAQGGYQVVLASGYSPAPISNLALEFELSQYADVSDAIGDAYDEQGHSFYTLTLPKADVSWTYDFTTTQWHRRGTWISEANAYTYWRPVFHSFSFGRHLMADRETGVIYRISPDLGMDVDGRVIRRVRRAPALNNEMRRLRYSRFEVLVQAGLGTSTGDGVDPQLMFRQSDDFGETFGNELQTSLGKIGTYGQRVIFWRIGQARGKVFEISTTATTPVRITDAFLRVQPSSEPQ